MSSDKSINDLSIEELRRALHVERSKSAELDKLLDLKIQEMCVLNTELSVMNSNLEQAVSARTSELQQSVLKLQHMAKVKSQFVSNMSHELRTPLNGVIGFAKILIDYMKRPNLTAEEILSSAQHIEHSGKRLLAHVERILDYSQLEDSQFASNSVDYSPHELTKEIEDNFRIMATQKKLKFELNLNPETPKNWHGDLKSICKIADVVIENAIKYTEAGSVIVSISHDKHPIKNCNVLTIKVQDTGPGMSEEELTQVFAPFSQSDNSDKRHFGGLGLGLTMASRLANAIGAEVRAVSETNKGSEFLIWYPDFSNITSATDSEVSRENQDPKLAVKAIAEKIRLLAVDDDESNLMLLKVNLAKLGVKCVTAMNGVEALQAFEREPSINVILMDCQMPVLNGVEATQKLRALSCKAAIIAVTANETQENRDICLEAGMNGFIPKPYTSDQLATAIMDSWWFLESVLEPEVA